MITITMNKITVMAVMIMVGRFHNHHRHSRYCSSKSYRVDDDNTATVTVQLVKDSRANSNHHLGGVHVPT